MEKRSARSNFGGRGWIVTIYTFLIFFSASCPALIFNATVPHFEAVLGVSNVTQQTILSIATAVGTIMVLITGQITLKKSVRKLAIIFGIIWAVAIIGLGLSSNMIAPGAPAGLIVFAVMMVICRAVGDPLTYSTNGTLVANWFPKKRGLVMGWATFGFPMASGIGVGIMSGIFGGSGSVMAAFIPPLFLGIIALLLLIFFLRDYPEQLGKYPDNDPTSVRENVEELEAVGEGEWTTKKCFSTKEFWLISVSLGLMLFTVGFMTQVGAALTSLGFPPDMVVPVMLGVMVVCCAGSYLCGVMDVKLGTRKAVIITDCILLVMGICAQFNSIVTIFIAFACMGVVVGGGSNFLVSWVSAIWGRRNFKPVFRWAVTICNIFGAFASGVIALIADKTNFHIAFAFAALMALIGGILAYFVKKDVNYSGDEPALPEQAPEAAE